MRSRCVHLGEGLLHAIDAGGGGLNQGQPVAHVAAPDHDRGGRKETRMEQTDAMEFLYSLEILDVGLRPIPCFRMTNRANRE
jgi:hypothetical protein